MARLNQPAVVGYILAGAILGPGGLGVMESRESVQLLAELGVLMLLFLIGMELSLRGFRDVWKVALTATLGQIAVAMACMLGLGKLLGWPMPLAITLGFAVALSSTAVVVKMLEQLGELRTRVGQVTIGILIAQDLAVVPMILIVGSFGGERGPGLDALIKVVLSVALLVLLILYLSRRERLRLPFERLVGDHVDLTPLAGLAVCFGAAAISGLLGLSVAYGAFLAGLVIGNSNARTNMLRHAEPIQAVLLMVFFLSIGLLMDLTFLWNNLGTVLLLVLFVTILKTAVNVGLLGLLGEPWPRAFQAGVLLSQIGEFSFVLAALGLSVGVVEPEYHRLVVVVTVLSLVLAPIWQEVARRLHRITLLGITSGREVVRVMCSRETRAVRQWAQLCAYAAGAVAARAGARRPQRGRIEAGEATVSEESQR
ncbi:cation:proton antiporter [Ferruginivarius sediminum]|uniref:Cation:proton antiporter n=2 Tax=Ferruginivarius sediminum TaxID=2661937 RepID=A0A369T9J6_9PROT|nr:cation:proton antiporter [Ferruginivarius sediminum]